MLVSKKEFWDITEGRKHGAREAMDAKAEEIHGSKPKTRAGPPGREFRIL